ncbi:YiiD C-terminal domain-containing protein [Marilutibacter chinensis]|uniref:Thioesterase domain-containing protein n=1 Tax=Marilutibacter chinensis TaxID=2912247 RepID=A0ABS9HXF0_9GAMM|nr:YiiD C-terminal domain-containing protein [Lysobacter chinensis]MCF7222859.1 thioesterase domain-containing protein [Lysobacter chinensis]
MSLETIAPPPPAALHLDDDALVRLKTHYDSMPPVAVMDLSIAGYDGRRLRLHAPLARHVNDKGCAFGGSLASMMTLASWGLVSLHVEAAGLDADVFVADSQIGYLAPLFADLDVEAEAAPGADWATFIATLRARGRARIGVVAHARLPEGGSATEFTARYVAIRRR